MLGGKYILFRLGEAKANGKGHQKKPLSPLDGQPKREGKIYDEAVGYDAAVEAMFHFGADGIGRVLDPHTVCIDLDGHDEESALYHEIVDLLGPTLVERSISGKGLHLWYTGTAEFWANHKVGIECITVPDGKQRFIALTEDWVTDAPMAVATVEQLGRLEARYRRAKAEVVDTTPMPAIDEGFVLPKIADEQVRAVVEDGEASGDRSDALRAAAVYLAGSYSRVQVFAILARSTGSWGLALDKRGGNPAKALTFLWTQSCKGLSEDAPPGFALVQAQDGAVDSAPLVLEPPGKDGKLAAHRVNVDILLGRGHTIRYDTFLHCEMVDGARYDNPTVPALAVELEQLGMRGPVNEKLIRSSIRHIAASNSSDIAQEFVRALVWDGKERVRGFCERYLRATGDVEYLDAVSRYMWTALVGRALEPGIKADMMPILTGGQALGKGLALQAIAPPIPGFDTYVEVYLTDSKEERARKTLGRFVVNYDELAGWGRGQLETLKQLITTPTDHVRRLYEEVPRDYRRRALWFGTTNRDDFLIDDTGNRRFLPVQIDQHTDVEGIKVDRAQLWAEAEAMFLGNGFEVDWRDAYRLAPAVHERYTEGDSLVDLVARYASAMELVTIADIIQAMNERQDRGTQMRVSAALKKLGYAKHDTTVGGTRTQKWVKGCGVVG